MADGVSSALALAEPRSAASAPERYLQSLLAAFEQAAAGAGAVEHQMAVGPWRVALRFAGEVSELMLPALAHLLPPSPAGHDATVCVFDTASTGVPVPPFTWRPRHLGPRGEVEGYCDERFRTVYHGDVFADDGGFDALSMYDDEARTAVFWVSRRDRIHWWERSEPLRPSFHWTLGGSRKFLAHAAVVGNGDGAVMLAAKGGSGKTTTALGCLEAGMEFLGDNYVLVSLDEQPVAHSMYRNAKVRPASLEHVPAVAARVDSLDIPEGEKLIVDVAASYPGQMAASLPLRALVVPRLTGRAETEIVPATPVDTLLALAPTTISQIPGNGSVLAKMAELTRVLPSYRLELGANPADGPRVLRDLLEAVS
jgi:hypothetical protein